MSYTMDGEARNVWLLDVCLVLTVGYLGTYDIVHCIVMERVVIGEGWLQER